MSARPGRRPGCVRSAASGFSPLPLPVQAGKIFDLGVADYDSDGSYDVFTTNHKFRGSLLRNDGEGGFADVYYETRNSPVAAVPGFNDLLRAPQIGPAGLYIWVDEERRTHVKAVGLGTVPAITEDSVAGTLTFAGRDAEVIRSERASIRLERDTSTNPPGGVVHFEVANGGSLVFRSRFMDLPFDVSIDPSFPRSRILAGPDLTHPPDSRFEVSFGDRHGLAWADLDADGDVDAYAAAGGLRGAIKRFQALTHDEVLNFEDGSYREISRDVGLGKGICRGRQGAVVDYDHDGILDLFSACERLHPILWRGRVDGTYGSRTHELSEVGVVASKYRWLDLTGGPALELLAVGRKEAVVFKEAANGWRRAYAVPTLNRDKRVDVIASGDADGDGDADIFVGSPSGNTLLVAGDGRLQPRNPTSLGLPAKSLTASWVDVDNDGRSELHALPGGIYEARAKRGKRGKQSFRRADLLQGKRSAKWATATWVDLDGDGDRDLIQAEKIKGVDRVKARAAENQVGRAGKRLSVDLAGPSSNPQSIGATLTLSDGRRHERLPVGAGEGSRWGQGHYRLYFGLGNSSADKLIARWPDGASAVLKDPPTNTHITIEHPDR